MTLTKFAIGWCGAILLAFGLAYVVAATPMLALAGLVDLAPTGLSDLRVMYGALQIAPGLFLLGSLRRPEAHEGAALLCTLMFASIVAIRVGSIVVDGTANQYHLAALAVEIPTTLVSWLGYRHARSAHQARPPRPS